jgi:hypothetical protein
MRAFTYLAIVALALFGAGCGDDSVADVDGGGVLLSVSDFDNAPNVVSVSNSGGLITMDVTISNVPKVAGGTAPTSDLQNVEMQTYEVTYTRADTGTRLPPPMVENIFGSAPAGGDIEYSGLAIMRSEQLLNEPLSDLSDFGVDRETGQQTILLNLNMRFYGRTLSGESVATQPISFTVEFRP